MTYEKPNMNNENENEENANHNIQFVPMSGNINNKY
jgi:hypothetical protein